MGDFFKDHGFYRFVLDFTVFQHYFLDRPAGVTEAQMLGNRADVVLYTILNLPFLKSDERCANSRGIVLQGGQDTTHRCLLDVRKMLRHSVSLAGGLRQLIKRRLLIVQISSQILVLFFGEITDDVFLWQP